jgi:hypothetical protein
VTAKEAMQTPKELEEQQMKEERMREVLLLIIYLINQEEATIKLIVDCLYDVGSVNLVNQKLQRSPLKAPAKGMAKLSKPIVKIIALRWFKKNGPPLITNWLRSKVAFKSPQTTPLSAVPAVANVPPAALPDNVNLEIRRLRTQVKVLGGISVGAIAALSGILVWLNYRPAVGTSSQAPQVSVPINDPAIDSPIDRTPTTRRSIQPSE